MTNLVLAAVAAELDYDEWTTTDDGELIPQITTDSVIHDMIDLLDLRPGMTVLEIGTGRVIHKVDRMIYATTTDPARTFSSRSCDEGVSRLRCNSSCRLVRCSQASNEDRRRAVAVRGYDGAG